VQLTTNTRISCQSAPCGGGLA